MALGAKGALSANKTAWRRFISVIFWLPLKVDFQRYPGGERQVPDEAPVIRAATGAVIRTASATQRSTSFGCVRAPNPAVCVSKKGITPAHKLAASVMTQQITNLAFASLGLVPAGQL
jgi:hypothetical protein